MSIGGMSHAVVRRKPAAYTSGARETSTEPKPRWTVRSASQATVSMIAFLTTPNP
jgi:hypothetical protein